MNPSPADLSVEPLDHRDPQVAARIHAVWLPAYEQEAALIGLAVFPPLQRSAHDIQRSGDFHIGALRAGTLEGVIAIGPDTEADHLSINALVVHPHHQRRGVASALLAEALRRGPGMAFCVTTAAGNAPALALYALLGFRPFRRGTLGDGVLPMLKLRRSP
ncbi:MAG: GNAT family N-acetyltransferase [Pseudomonadota bacterium]|nr:GNAT family N-acetyltransferase [Pseudomonadota bacterium]